MEYLLKNNDAVAVVSTAGGELISYSVNGKEYLWNGDEKYWAGHAPVLFPFVSALADNTVKISGTPCVFKDKHGFARKYEYTVEKINDREAVFLLVSDESTREQYPYDFELRIIHRMTSSGFTTTYSVTNVDNTDIIFCIGGHPGILLNEPIDKYKFNFDKQIAPDIFLVDSECRFSFDYKSDVKFKENGVLSLNYSDFDRDALLLCECGAESVSMVLKEDESTGIKFGFAGFPVLAIWTPPKKQAPFICLEPWHGLPALVGESGNFEDKPYAVTLKPGEMREFTYSFDVF